MSTSQRPEVICRLIAEDDFDEVVACLRRGFPERPRRYWESTLEWMSRRPAIADHPRFGRALLVGRNVVGVILMTVSRDDDGADAAIRCNLSGWCVDEAYRRHAAMLYMQCIRNNELTYTGPVAGLAGRYLTDRAAKYCRGPAPPSPGDLSNRELAALGT